MRRILAVPNQIVVFGASKMQLLTRLSTAVVVWVELEMIRCDCMSRKMRRESFLGSDFEFDMYRIKCINYSDP